MNQIRSREENQGKAVAGISCASDPLAFAELQQHDWRQRPGYYLMLLRQSLRWRRRKVPTFQPVQAS
ncbi:MAG: hypothetical protein AB1705_02065 [Verrucomicrobiota bacterium]